MSVNIEIYSPQNKTKLYNMREEEEEKELSKKTQLFWVYLFSLLQKTKSVLKPQKAFISVQIRTFKHSATNLSSQKLLF